MTCDRRAGRPLLFHFSHTRIVSVQKAIGAAASKARDANNDFPAFAERFVELATGLSVHSKGQGVGRQIEKALKDCRAIEEERARLLRETRLK